MLKGIDVYTGQGNIDWQAVKNSGVDFAMIKASQGRSERNPRDYLFPDPRFSTNIQRAYDAGILCGVYHYLTAQTLDDADAEAQLFLDTIQPYRGLISLYAAVDVESKYIRDLPMQELTDIVSRFYDAVEAAGYRAMIYTNPDWLRYRLGDIGDKRLWLACWPKKVDADNPPNYANLKIWQWGKAYIDGITVGDGVDSDFGYFDDMFTETPPADEAPAEIINADEGDENMIRYSKLSDIPNDCGFRDIVETLMNAEIINGDGADKTGNDDVIDLSHDQVRTIVFEYRGGAFDRALIAKGIPPVIEV